MFTIDKFDLNRIAFISDETEEMSYSVMNDYSLSIYQKINRRCLVFCLSENSPGSLVGYYTFISRSVVPLMLDSNLDNELLFRLIELYRPEFLWVPKRLKNNFCDFQQKYETLDYLLLETNLIPLKLYENLAILLTTSGTTGSPKLVRLSYQNLKENAASIVAYLNLSKDDRPITSLPMNYSYGLSVINSHFLVGASILLTNKSVLQKGFWNFFKLHNATSFSGVPYTYEMLHKMKVHRLALPSLKVFTQAGGKLNIDLTEKFVEYANETGRKFFVMYGQTEATARMSYLPFEIAESKLGSIGIAIPGGKFELIDEAGNIIEENEVSGELLYTGTNVSLGYAESGEDLDKGDENYGQLQTGDIAKRDVDGFYYIIGRKKRFIKIFGNRINLDEAEQILKKIIPECACTGSDDKMEIFITESNRIDEVRNYISNKLSLHHSGFAVKQIEEIPKSNAGKTEYSKLKQLWS